MYFSSPELKEKIFENRRKSGNTQGKLICKTAMNPGQVNRLGVGGSYVCCLVIVVIFMGLGEAKK